MANQTSIPEDKFDTAHASDYIAKCVELDQDRNSFMKSLLKRLTKQESEVRVLSLELEHQTESRQSYQQQFKGLEQTLASLNRKIARGAFVVVLIDGDGAKFTDELLQSYETGGQEAARRLKEAIRHYLGQVNPELLEDDIPVLVKIWANLGDLGYALCNNGSIKTKDQMLHFAETFSKSRAEFDFVNVGRGKENADSKMRKMLNFYFNDIHCKKIIFACCHDTGYVHDLREKQGMEDAEQRIVLLETTPAEPHFRQLGFPITNFDTVFRSTALDNEEKKSKGSFVNPRIHEETYQAVKSPSVPLISPRNLERSSIENALDKDSGNDTKSSLASVTFSSNGGLSMNYASAGGSTEHRNISIPRSEHKKKRRILFDEARRRLDPPNGRWSTASQQSYNDKVDMIKPAVFCNDFYLVGRCHWGSSCSRKHGPELTSEELVIHRFRARNGLCAIGPSCQDFDCFFSHRCPFGRSCRKGAECTFTKSYHGDLHFGKTIEDKPGFQLVEGQQSLIKL